MNFLAINCDSSGLLGLFYILKLALSVICIVTPVVLTVSSMIYLTKQLIAGEPAKDVALVIAKKIILAISVFLVLPVVNSVMVLLDQGSFQETSCWQSATLANVKSLKAAEQLELEAKVNAEQEAKAQEEFENQVDQNNGSSGGSSDGGSSGGSSDGGLIGGSSGNDYPGGNYGTPDPSSLGFGYKCTGFVSSNTYNSSLVNRILTSASSHLGTSYGTMDCSDFVSDVYSGYVPDTTAAGLANNSKTKCVTRDDIRPGDVFFVSNYNSSGKCTHCVGSTFGNRCDRFNCIMHVGIVLEASNGQITSIIHSTPSGENGVQITTNPTKYSWDPNSNGNSWYIMITRPYA